MSGSIVKANVMAPVRDQNTSGSVAPSANARAGNVRSTLCLDGIAFDEDTGLERRARADRAGAAADCGAAGAGVGSAGRVVAGAVQAGRARAARRPDRALSRCAARAGPDGVDLSDRGRSGGALGEVETAPDRSRARRRD